MACLANYYLNEYYPDITFQEYPKKIFSLKKKCRRLMSKNEISFGPLAVWAKEVTFKKGCFVTLCDLQTGLFHTTINCPTRSVRDPPRKE